MTMLFVILFVLLLGSETKAKQSFLAPNDMMIETTPLSTSLLSASGALETSTQEDSTEVMFDNGILVITESNIEEALSLYPNIVIVFYQGGCHVYDTFLPMLENLSEELAGFEVYLAKAEVGANRNLISEFEITYSPETLAIQSSSILDEFWNQRTVENVVEWLEDVYEISNLSEEIL